MKKIGRTEFENQLKKAKSNPKSEAKLEKQRKKRMGNLDRHIDNYMLRTMNTISRCGKGLSVEMVNNPPSNDADGWFKVYKIIFGLKPASIWMHLLIWNDCLAF